MHAEFNDFKRIFTHLLRTRLFEQVLVDANFRALYRLICGHKRIV